jgi:hypothetical protein
LIEDIIPVPDHVYEGELTDELAVKVTLGVTQLTESPGYEFIDEVKAVPSGQLAKSLVAGKFAEDTVKFITEPEITPT